MSTTKTYDIIVIYWYIHNAITVDNSNIVNVGVLLLTLPPSCLIGSVHSSCILGSFVFSVVDIVVTVVGIVDGDGDVLSSASIKLDYKFSVTTTCGYVASYSFISFKLTILCSYICTYVYTYIYSY